MNQLVFDFTPQALPSFNDFLGQGNIALVRALKLRQERLLYLWGSAGAGKSHLLQAWIGDVKGGGAEAFYVNAAQESLLDWVRDADCLAVDHVENLNAQEQVILFSIFNQFKDQSDGFLLLAGNVPPAQLNLREDLRTRMGACLVYEVKPLSDEEKISALMALAKNRQLTVSVEVFNYLLAHWRRDLASLLAMFNVLDKYSLATKKPITLYLLKTLLNQEKPFDELSHF